MNPGQGFDAELERLRKEFELGDYLSFVGALMLCTKNQLPLPAWVATWALDAAAFAFEHKPTGRGRGSNLTATTRAKEIEDCRADLAHRHLKACWREGRDTLSLLGAMHGYGRADPTRPHFHIVTRADIFGFVAKELRETFARGTARQIEEDYVRAVRAGRYA